MDVSQRESFEPRIVHIGGEFKDKYERSLQTFTNSRTAVIRTSDRGQFRNCRRKWALQSPLHRHLEPVQAANPLWFGTGVHFALEDHHGKQLYEHPAEALEDYVQATVELQRQIMPNDWKDTAEMGIKMLEYYENHWLKSRDPLNTYYVDGVPQVEVNFIVDVPFDIKARGWGDYWDDVVYAGTIDRVTIDEDGFLWLVDYKTAKQMRTTHFQNDSQVSAYCWAASHIYNRPVMGLILWQFLKDVPKGPRILKNGDVSVAQNQVTCHPLYKQALIDTYGSVAKSPVNNVDFLNYLVQFESEDHDKFIRRDRIYRSDRQHESEGVKILMELEDMLNPDLPLYPNPTFLCPSMCSFYEVCVSMDDGSDWMQQLKDETQSRDHIEESWRHCLKNDTLVDAYRQAEKDNQSEGMFE